MAEHENKNRGLYDYIGKYEGDITYRAKNVWDKYDSSHEGKRCREIKEFTKKHGSYKYPSAKEYEEYINEWE